MRKFFVMIICSMIFALPGSAFAASNKNFGYTIKNMWSSLIRMIRVDSGYKITDQDKENGFVLFVYPGQGKYKECPASAELIESDDEENSVQLKLNIEHQPSYIEVQFLERFENKLMDELGAPRESRPKNKSHKKSDSDKEKKSAQKPKHSDDDMMTDKADGQSGSDDKMANQNGEEEGSR